jgi:hypothetical protein
MGNIHGIEDIIAQLGVLPAQALPAARTGR